jgi:hypothetical protein
MPVEVTKLPPAAVADELTVEAVEAVLVEGITELIGLHPRCCWSLVSASPGKT